MRTFPFMNTTAVLLLGAMVSSGAATTGLRHSKHNLALAGAATTGVASESEMCNFCHTPHSGMGQRALWTHSLSTALYIPYSSSTMKATVGQPTGDSKLCLSCHDGTVALGMTQRQKANVASRAASTRMAPGRAVLGTDLSDDHPISFSYDTSLSSGAQLKDRALLNEQVRLDANGQVQCTSCHDPHNDQNGMFLVQNNYASGLCLNCHDSDLWTSSSHRTSARTWNGTGRNPWPHTSETTVSGNGCENCHAPHNAGTHQRLLNYPLAEDNCLVCHNGSVAAKNVAVEFNKPSAHPVLRTSSLHDAAEDPISPKARHASCVDCHNPHAANATPGIRPNASGALAGVAGANVNGVVVKNVTREYELCFRCHSEGVVKVYTDLIRQWPEPSVRLQFATANASYHPIEGVGKNAAVPSLILPWNTASLMYCTDCHNNNEGSGAGGNGPNGPHGSLFAPLLEANLVRQDFQAESPGTYALCYKCHDRNSILADQSFRANTPNGERGHRFHIVDVQASCTTCHDAHGVAGQARLINFNTFYVSGYTNVFTNALSMAPAIKAPLGGHSFTTPSVSARKAFSRTGPFGVGGAPPVPGASGGLIEFRSTGTLSGTCTLTCHDFPHNNVAYPMPMALTPALKKPLKRSR